MGIFDDYLNTIAGEFVMQDDSDPENQYPSHGCRTLQKHYEAFLETLCPNVRKRVEALKEIHRQHEDLEAKLREEKAAVDAKYQKLYQPLYTKRYEIVSGITEVAGNADEDARDQDGNKTEAKRGVPGFWLKAMKRKSVLAMEIHKRDKAALEYLQDIKWSRIDDPKGFKLEFVFASNPFFKNSVLTKTYHMTDEDKSIVAEAIGTTIEWYPGKCLTTKVLKKKHKTVFNYMRPDRESFFKFFNTPQVPADIDDDLEDFRTHELEPDYEMGSAIRDIIPQALSWFTGEAEHIDGDDCGFCDDDGYDDSDSDSDDEEDEDDADSEAHRKGPPFNIPSSNKRSIKITYPDGRPFILDPLARTQNASPIVQTELSKKT